MASVPTSALMAGTDSMGVTYNGNSDFAMSGGDAVQTVNKASTTTTLTSALNPSGYGQTVTFSVTVAAVASGAGTPTGMVTFTVDSQTQLER